MGIMLCIIAMNLSMCYKQTSESFQPKLWGSVYVETKHMWGLS